MIAIAPGGRIGVLGGGQLGRMLALAAARLGYRVHVFAPDAADGPAGQVAAARTAAAYDDARALQSFAAAVDVVTFEFENVPAAALEALAAVVPVRPSPRALAVTQDRLVEKRFVQDAGVAVPPFVQVDGPGDLAPAAETTGLPAVLKTRRFGYDGKGQAKLAALPDADAAWDAIGAAPAILEAFVPFEREISVVAARGFDGAIACYPPAENRHENHILRTSTAPALLPDETAARAVQIARTLLERLDYVGVLGVELFLEKGGRLLVNELAPRVHNSGHWTMDGAATSQFEQHVRAICGLPLGSPDALARAEMTNLLGDEIDGWAALLAEPNARLHLYGKGEARPGRKMGHVTRLSPLRP
jgi:5-(carboxyamino)imidazole ribonucleotide synthase